MLSTSMKDHYQSNHYYRRILEKCTFRDKIVRIVVQHSAAVLEVFVGLELLEPLFESFFEHASWKIIKILIEQLIVLKLTSSKKENAMKQQKKHTERKMLRKSRAVVNALRERRSSTSITYLFTALLLAPP